MAYLANFSVYFIPFTHTVSQSMEMLSDTVSVRDSAVPHFGNNPTVMLLVLKAPFDCPNPVALFLVDIITSDFIDQLLCAVCFRYALSDFQCEFRSCVNVCFVR